MLKLFHNDMSVCAQKVRLVMVHKELQWEGVHLNLRAGDQFQPEFQKINPKGVVPVLQHNGSTITESNAIIEYLDEVFPHPPLMPDNPIKRAIVRNWMIRLDAGLHENIAVISFCVAFRHQLLQRHPDPESLEEFLSNIPDPSRASVMRDVVPNGLKSPRLLQALYAYNKVLKDMNEALTQSDWLAGQQLSLADFSLLPYLERLQQLGMAEWWVDYPAISQWLERVTQTPAYCKGMADWHNPSYIELMHQKGADVWPKVKTLIADL